MSRTVSASDVVGEWILARDESRGDLLVFEGVTAAVGRRRGLEKIAFRSDGTMTRKRSGADDRLIESDGTWTLDEHGLLAVEIPGLEHRRYELVSVDAARLTLRPLSV